MNSPYASGNWVVIAGCEPEFVRRWNELLQWTRSSFPELRSAQLIQESDDPRHFVSFSAWNSAEAMQEWRSRREFSAMLGACRALCDDFHGSDFVLAAAV